MSARAAVVSCLLALAAPALAGSVAPRLDEALRSAGPDELVPVVVVMEAPSVGADLKADVRKMTRRSRRDHVVSVLKNIARRSQAPVHSLLEALPDRVRSVRVLLGVNGVALEATPDVIDRLASLPSVRWVLYDRGGPHPGTDVAPSSYTPLAPLPARGSSHAEATGPTGGDVSGPNPEATVAEEVTAMGAEQVWSQLGYTGAGVIVAIIDTGVDRTHPDLADHVWTNLGEVADNGIDDDGNGLVDDTWGWDFCVDSNDPSAGSHGTQVAGQVAGDGTGGTVTGMAPDVELMALGIDCDTPSIGWQASDYAILHGADLVSQSYSWWWTDQPDYETFRRQADAELAAGMIHVNSAGNHGGNPTTYPVPYNISTPANCPAPWIHPDQTLVGGVSSTIGVGNISWFTDLIHSSSSLGPSAWEDIRANTDPDYPFPMSTEYQDYPHENGAQMGLIKPDISAYGDGTTSTCPGPSYCQFSGTSSAAPHVTGVLALMLQSNPEATPAELAEALLTTAEHRGDPGKNNTYGVGLVQAVPAVEAIQSGVLYDSHSFDDTEAGNGDLGLDPGERVTVQITVRSVTDDGPIHGLEAILSTSTPGVTIHDQLATFPVVPAGGSAVSNAPHYSLTVDPGLCATEITLDLELRFEESIRRSTFDVRVGDETPSTLLGDSFESDLGWATDPGTATRGFWVREDPEGVPDDQSRLANPEDDTTPDPGVTCWVTGNGRLNGPNNENNNDVDDGAVTLTSPPFGSPYLLSLDLQYDRWYYDPSGPAADSFRTELSNDGGANWTPVETLVFGFGEWETRSADLFALLPPTDDMRLRFVVSDGVDDSPVEGAVDEVTISGVLVECQDHVPPAAQAPNPVGDTLRVATGGDHVVLSWDPPPVDATHDAATLYRVERASFADGTFAVVGSATTTSWTDVDALGAPDSYHYRVYAENAGGSEGP